MKKLMVALFTFCALHHCAYADYYSAAGGGVYELYVNDCSASGMRRALDNAVAAKKAVITKVICEQQVQNNETVNVFAGWDFDSLPIVELCSCTAVAMCGC